METTNPRVLACQYALEVATIWSSAPAVLQYLETQNDTLRPATYAAAQYTVRETKSTIDKAEARYLQRTRRRAAIHNQSRFAQRAWQRNARYYAALAAALASAETISAATAQAVARYAAKAKSYQAQATR